MTYQRYFPGHALGAQIEQLVAAGWTDESWQNDEAPRVHCGNAYCLWIDDQSDAPFILEKLEDGQFGIEDGTVGVFTTLKGALGALYADLVGYDPFADDPSQTVEDVAKLAAEVVREGEAA